MLRLTAELTEVLMKLMRQITIPVKNSRGFIQHYLYAESEYYCLKCSQKTVWEDMILVDGHDEGISYICISCDTHYVIPDMHPIDLEDDQLHQILIAIKNFDKEVT